MSSSNRTTSKGGKGSKNEKSHKVEKSDTGKGEKQQTGGGENIRSKSDDPSIKEKVRQIIEMTQRSEEEVCLALHECDNDTEQAINMLFENVVQGEWETSVKKKKNRQASASKTEAQEAVAGDEWQETQIHTTDKEKPRNKTGGPPRLHGRHNDSRGWRGREKQENERNLEEGSGSRPDHRERRGRSGGPTRGGGGGRGRGGGRAGGRYPPRNRNSYSNTRPIETWDNSTTWDSNTATNANHTEETWDEFPSTDDWSTEEYTGSLADTKVFTPSVQQELAQMEAAGADPSVVGTTPIPMDGTDLNATQQLSQALDIRTQLPPQSQLQSQNTGQMVALVQTQYINQLTQQSSESIKVHQQYNNTAQVYNATTAQAYGTTPPQTYDKTTGQVYNSASGVSQVYSNNSTQPYGNPAANTYVNSNYPVNSNYSGAPDQPAPQPVRTKTQRARVPPPSKIPASAVEMPGDLNSSIGYLDVQFGAMDFMSDSSSFDGVPDTKYVSANNSNLENTSATPSSNLDLNSGTQNTPLDAYSPSKPNTQCSISSALTQSLSNTDSIPQTSEHIPNAYNATSRSSTGSTATQSVTPSGLDLNKQSESHSYSQSSNYNSYQPKSSSYQAQYNSSNYSATQTTTNSYVSNQSSNNFVNSNAGSYNPPSAGSTYQNTYSSTSSYQPNANTSAFPAITQPNSYPANNQSYQQNTSQSAYGANTGLNNSSNYGSSTSGSNQYNSYNSGSNHKLVKDNYEGSTTAVSTTGTTTSSVNSTSTALSLTQTSTTGTKAMNTLSKNSSVVSNIHPGVTPVMSTTPYLVTGQVPYFQQPIYSYEDMQLLQQRIPHMTTPYYDMSYQTPTTLAAVRDGALANVAYSISDARFTRGDNNASPVPSTLSQQTNTLTQGHQAAPILAQTGHPYFFPSTYNPMTPSYQFVYPQMPAATNAHGSSNSNQYPKPGTYGSGYGSGYDALSQSQDYSKGGYVGNTQGQNKASGANATSTGSTGNDLSVAIYGKSHAALGKVNSYEKQGFHSGTPPPFTGALHGSQNAGLAPSGTGYGPQMYIPTMTPHQQHHSTPLMHQVHQMEVRHQGRRMDSGNSTGQRSQATNQGKTGAKQGYPASYWNQA